MAEIKSTSINPTTTATTATTTKTIASKNPFLSSYAVEGYAKTNNAWLMRNLTPNKRNQQAQRAETASKWLNQLLETEEASKNETYA